MKITMIAIDDIDVWDQFRPIITKAVRGLAGLEKLLRLL